MHFSHHLLSLAFNSTIPSFIRPVRVSEYEVDVTCLSVCLSVFLTVCLYVAELNRSVKLNYLNYLARKCLKVSESVRKSPKVPKNFQKCSRVSKNSYSIQKCPNVSKSVRVS